MTKSLACNFVTWQYHTHAYIWHFILFLKIILFYLFIFRERGRKGERGGGKHQCVVISHESPTGDLPITQACALTGNEISNALVCSLHSIHWVTPPGPRWHFRWNIQIAVHLMKTFMYPPPLSGIISARTCILQFTKVPDYWVYDNFVHRITLADCLWNFWDLFFLQIWLTFICDCLLILYP